MVKPPGPLQRFLSEPAVFLPIILAVVTAVLIALIWYCDFVLHIYHAPWRAR